MANANDTVWLNLVELAQGEGPVQAAARKVLSERGIPLRALEREILDAGDPPLQATIAAAADFSRATNYPGRLAGLPYLEHIYALALDNPALPRVIFNRAAAIFAETPDIAVAIRSALLVETCPARPARH